MRESINSPRELSARRSKWQTRWGSGSWRRYYENALAHELRKQGLRVDQQRPVDVFYDGIIVGVYVIDLVVEGIVPVELKAAKALDEAHRAQGLNHLRATGFHINLLINFGTPKIEIKRLANPLLKSSND